MIAMNVRFRKDLNEISDSREIDTTLLHEREDLLDGAKIAFEMEEYHATIVMAMDCLTSLLEESDCDKETDSIIVRVVSLPLPLILEQTLIRFNRVHQAVLLEHEPPSHSLAQFSINAVERLQDFLNVMAHSTQHRIEWKKYTEGELRAIISVLGKIDTKEIEEDRLDRVWCGMPQDLEILLLVAKRELNERVTSPRTTL